jgi:hypothetical protein
MSFFSIFKKQKDIEREYFAEVYSQMFPNGEEDIKAGTKDFMLIFENIFNTEKAKSIFNRTMFLNSTIEKFSLEMLKSYFDRNIEAIVSQEQYKYYFGYLTFVKAMRVLVTSVQMIFEGIKMDMFAD